jgi:hypothetical protein
MYDVNKLLTSYENTPFLSGRKNWASAIVLYK